MCQGRGCHRELAAGVWARQHGGDVVASPVFRTQPTSQISQQDKEKASQELLLPGPKETLEQAHTQLPAQQAAPRRAPRPQPHAACCSRDPPSIPSQWAPPDAFPLSCADCRRALVKRNKKGCCTSWQGQATVALLGSCAQAATRHGQALPQPSTAASSEDRSSPEGGLGGGGRGPGPPAVTLGPPPGPAPSERSLPLPWYLGWHWRPGVSSSALCLDTETARDFLYNLGFPGSSSEHQETHRAAPGLWW